ncbi:hypothetical protein TSAR_015970 [Trichomalopsis sarcophagae]|uniref:DUF3105 domain-containing protein n=1 Tax=Trichomalopsis sarcophagae TaxID=543379 RepID=A0A232EH55_9HYME|nr:hypothetical protein TSAR_015970 [Trichomalopsis sarcophagae]
MSYANRFTFFLWKIALIGCVLAFPDKYEVQDADTNMKFNLLDVLNEYTESEKDQHRDSTEDPFEHWTGAWMPHQPGEATPPPKIFHKKPNDDIPHQNGRTPMGAKYDCDDGKTNLTVDWDHSPTSYTCYGQKIVPDADINPQVYCETIPKNYVAYHACMSETIEYDDYIPLYGTHRPVWPVYGEYKYVPKQRWLHTLEHGGVVMLYHPCANAIEVDRLKQLVKGCLRRHVITPYNMLDEERPLAVLTWGCRLTMSLVNKEVVTQFIKENVFHAPENDVYRDGDFDDQIIEKAKIISDIQDSVVCSKLM